MDLLFWAKTVLILGGVGIRVVSWRQYVNLLAHRYSSPPPRRWLWTRASDPDVERWRRMMVLGSVLTIAGLALIIVDVVA